MFRTPFGYAANFLDDFKQPSSRGCRVAPTELHRPHTVTSRGLARHPSGSKRFDRRTGQLRKNCGPVGAVAIELGISRKMAIRQMAGLSLVALFLFGLLVQFLVFKLGIVNWASLGVGLLFGRDHWGCLAGRQFAPRRHEKLWFSNSPSRRKFTHQNHTALAQRCSGRWSARFGIWNLAPLY